MNKFKSDILNFANASHDAIDKLMRTICQDVNLYEAMKIGNTLAKVGKAHSELSQLIYAIDDSDPVSK